MSHIKLADFKRGLAIGAIFTASLIGLGRAGPLAKQAFEGISQMTASSSEPRMLEKDEVLVLVDSKTGQVVGPIFCIGTKGGLNVTRVDPLTPIHDFQDPRLRVATRSTMTGPSAAEALQQYLPMLRDLWKQGDLSAFKVKERDILRNGADGWVSLRLVPDPNGGILDMTQEGQNALAQFPLSSSDRRQAQR